MGRVLGMLFFVGAVAMADYSLFKAGNRMTGWHGGQPTTEQEFLDKVQPILLRRCVSCHGCYEAPCQTNLQSYEGVRRGYHPEPIYGVKRWWSVKPSRLKDAKSTSEWRDKGFLETVSHDEDPEDPPQDSVMYRLIHQSGQNNVAATQTSRGFSFETLLSLQEEIDSTSKFQCVASDSQYAKYYARFRQNRWGVMSLSDYLNRNRMGGMPFGLPRLNPETEEATLKGWLDRGAKGPSVDEKALLEKPSDVGIPVIRRWEAFFNQNSNQARLSSRFIYEHVYTAHFHFDENPGEFFELVRSKTSEGRIDEIVTELPYDSPGNSAFYYRLKKVTEAIVQKKHIVWHLNESRLSHLTALFLSSHWGTEPISLPGYESPNPFENFARIPARIRARFMIENSRIIIGAMVQGAVCVGSIATFAIRDHFWVWFLNPESDVSVVNPMLGLGSWEDFGTSPIDEEWQPVTRVGKLLKSRLENTSLLKPENVKELVETLGILDGDGDALALRLAKEGVPVKKIIAALSHYKRTSDANRLYQQAYEYQLRLLLKSRSKKGLALSDLWKGDGDSSYPEGNNPNAWLNVTRHEKSATVQYGDEGGKPQSIWVLSFSNFERLYYNLVVHFKSWGAIDHRLASWRIMSYVRLEAEDLAISFLPKEHRKEVRDEFTRGLGRLKDRFFFPQYSLEKMWIPVHGWLDEKLPGRPAGEQSELIDSAPESVRWLVHRVRNTLSRVSSSVGNESNSSNQREFEGELRQLSHRSEISVGAMYAQFFPNISYIRIRGEKNHALFTIHADRTYKAHNFFLGDKLYPDPAYNTIAVYHGAVGAFPNVFFDISESQTGAFLSDMRKVSDEASWQRFRSRYGIARNSEDFWTFFDWLHEFRTKESPNNVPSEQGIVDLSQYSFF